MTDKKVFKVWDSTRTIKKCIACFPKLDDLKEKGQMQFKKQIDHIVFESDGSEIDDDSVVEFLEKSDILMLLGPEEVWTDQNNQHEDFSINNINEMEDSNGQPVIIEVKSLNVQETITDGNMDEKSSSTSTSAQQSLVTLAGKRKFNDVSPSTSSASPLIQYQASFDERRSTRKAFANYEIPWNKISNATIELLEKSNPCDRIPYRQRTEIANAIVADMKTIATKIFKDTWLDIAEKVVLKYPSLLDRDERGNIQGKGYGGLANSMKNNFYYTLRPSNTPKEKRATVNERKVQKIRSCRSIAARWISEGNLCTEDILTSLQQLDGESVDPEEFETLLQESYGYFRDRITKDGNVANLMNEYPILFRSDAIFWHFFHLTQFDVSNMVTNFENLKASLINYAVASKYILDVEIADDYLNKILFEFIADNFKEKENINSYLFVDYDVGTRKIDIDPEMKNPVIAIVDDTDARFYYVFADGLCLTGMTNQLLVAFMEMMCLYWIFDYKYPKEISKTLAFVEYYLIGINETRIPPAVKKFFKKLNVNP